ncbi:D-glycerate 2-kinase [Methylorubrum thiocyanatum]
MTGPRYIKEHTAQWRGVSLRIQWEPQRAPLPITETGYLSWFTAPALVQESGGPVAFVLQWLDAEAAGPAWAEAETDRRQLSLFG